MFFIIRYIFIISFFFGSYNFEILSNYWSFSGDLTDSAGDANLTIGANAFFTTDRFNNNNSAIRLEDGYLIAPNGVYFEDEFTFTTWIKLHSVRRFSRIIDFGGGESLDNVEIAFKENKKSIFIKTWYQDQNSNFLETPKEIVLNEWTHVAVAFKDYTAKIYLNGILVTEGTQLPPRDVTRTKNYIGKSNFGDPNVNATFDEIKIFSKELNASEILDEYYFNSTKSKASQLVNSTGLLYYWKFNNNLKDQMNNSDLYGGYNYYFTKDRFNKLKSALDLKEGYASFLPLYRFNTDFTIMAWIKLNQIRYNSRIFECGNWQNQDDIVVKFYGYSSSVSLDIYNKNSESYVKSVRQLAINEWVHVAVVYKNNMGYIYLDGELDTNRSMISPGDVTRKFCYIGASNRHLNLGYFTIDEMKIYDVAVNETLIRNESKNKEEKQNKQNKDKDTSSKYKPVIKDGLQSYWPFNGDTKDYSGSSHITEGENYDFEKDRFGTVNSAIYLSGGYMVVPNNNYFDKDFTLSFWFKLESDYSTTYLLNFDSLTSTSYSRYNSYNSYSSFSISAYNRVITFTRPNTYSSNTYTVTSIESLTKWTHLAICYNSEPYIEIYLNGRLELVTSNVGQKRITKYSTSKNYIGYYNSYSYYYTTSSYYYTTYSYYSRSSYAYLDEFKIYERSLSEYEIWQDYSYPVLSNKQISTKEPIFYWPFSGSYLEANGHTKILIGRNFKLANDRFDNPKSALDLSQGYLKLSTGIYFNREFTISVWIKMRSHNHYSRIIDIGNGEFMDNIILGFSQGTGSIYFEIHSGRHSKGHLIANKKIELNIWTFVAVTFSKGEAKIYYNCEQVAVGTQYMPKNINRTSNYIGKSNWIADELVDAIIDELKIYDRNVSINELAEEYNQKQFLSGTTRKILIILAISLTITIFVIGIIWINRYLIKNNYFRRSLNLLFRNTNHSENLCQNFE